MKSSAKVVKPKRTRIPKVKPFFQLNEDNERIASCILKHAKGKYCTSVKLTNDKYKSFSFFHAGFTHTGGGIHTLLEKTYYSHYKMNRSRRNHKRVNVRGSNSGKGKTVDRQMTEWARLGGRGKRPKRLNPLAGALMKHLEDIGHIPQAAQLPVMIPDTRPHRMTQSDLITRDGFGRLWLWEVKSGYPVGGFRKQGVLDRNVVDRKGQPVTCTKHSIWQLQLHFTRTALEAAGIDIAEARVIQVHEDKRKDKPIVTVHNQAEWVKKLKLTTL